MIQPLSRMIGSTEGNYFEQRNDLTVLRVLAPIKHIRHINAFIFDTYLFNSYLSTDLAFRKSSRDKL